MVVENGSSLKDLYEEWIEDDIIEIRELNSENKVYQEIREQNTDWEIIEGCREILFIHAQNIKRLKERIDETRERIKKLI